MINNSFRQGILNRALLLSTGLRDRMTETYGISNFNGLKESELDVYYPDALSYIEGELSQMGIKFIPTVNVRESAELIRTMMMLRGTFDDQALLKTFAAEDSIRQLYSDIMENSEFEPDVLLTTIIEKMHELVPLSDLWTKLNEQRFNVLNTDRFITYLYDLLNVEISVSDTNAKRLASYAKLIFTHVSEVKAVIAKLVNLDEVETSFGDINFGAYDRDLAHIPVGDLEFYLDTGNMHPLFRREVGDTPFMANHKANNDHHFEYFITKGISMPTEQQMLKLVGEYSISAWNREARLNVVNGLLQQTQFPEEIRNKILVLVSEGALTNE